MSTAGKPLSLHALVRALRPHQWVKNLLVFVPMVATLDMTRAEPFLTSLIAFAAFCLVASSVYLLNDIADLEADRSHARKKFRPLASGEFAVRHALVLVPALLLVGFALAAFLPLLFVGLLALYFAITTFYTLWIKRIPLLDTIVLAGLYTLRILAGAAAITVEPSVWLLAFSMFLFLSVALAKRHSELMELGGAMRLGALPGREYRPEDLSTLISQGVASGYAAVLVLALYIDSNEVRAQYRHPEIIWLICPLLLYWINKLWLNSQRREIEDDPLIWALTNRVSRGLVLLSVTLLLLARWLP